MGLKLVPGALVSLLLLAGQWSPAPGVTYRAARSPLSHVQSTPAQSALAATRKNPRLPLHAYRTAPVAATPGLLTPPTIVGATVLLFNGLNQPGLRATDNSFETVPPDTTGAIGPGYYVETVNSVIGVYSRSALGLVSKAAFSTWLLVTESTAQPCDPQIQWDPSSQRFLYVVLECKIGDDAFLFGWSKTADPADLVNGWCRFSESTPNVISDYPKLGHSGGHMLVGTNDFSDAGNNPFTTAQIFWMNTPAPGDASCTAPTVSKTSTTLFNGDGFTQTFTPVPVNTTSNASNGYVVSAYDPSSGPTPQNKLALWHLDSGGTLHQDSDLTVNTYSVPSPAPDLGGSSFGLDTLDGRLTQAIGDPITGIYTQHTVNGAGGRSKVTWYEIQVVSSVPTLTQEGDIASTTDFVFNGSISPRSDGQGAAIFYNRSSATIDPVIAGRVREASTPTGQMDSGEIVLATSSAGDADFSCNFHGTGAPCRWGDYSGASPDPLNCNVVWGSNQFLTSPSTSAPNWVSENYAILIPTPAAARCVLQSFPAPTPSPRPVNQSSPSPTPGTR